MSGLTHTSGLPGQEPAGWGYSYMDHTGGYVMAIALLAALYHQRRTGEGQWVDLACIEAGIAMTGPAALDATRQRPRRCATTAPCNSNRSPSPAMAPHGIYPCRDDDSWVAIACRHDADWAALVDVIGEPWAKDAALATLAGRLDAQDRLDADARRRGRRRGRATTSSRAVRGAGVPAAPVTRPPERCDTDAASQAWGLWPTVDPHQARPAAGRRAAGAPVGAPTGRSRAAGRCSARTTSGCSSEVLGLSPAEIGRLADEGVI